MNDSSKPLATGSIQLDEILGGTGIPDGSITEVFGEQGTGKTTLALELIQTVQSRNGQAAYIDAEHSMNVEYARNVGVQPDRLLFAQPDTAEEGLDIAEELAGTGTMDLIVVDSAAALVPGRERDGGFEEDTAPEQAQILSRSLRKLSPSLKQSGTVLCFTNQVRSRLNRPVGPDETTPGGNALKLYASVRIRLEQVDPIQEGNDVIGRRINVQVVKNRSAPPDRSVELDLLFDRGICPYGDLLDAGRAYGVIEQDVSGYSFHKTRLGGDRSAARERLEQRPDLCETIQDEISSSRSVGSDQSD